MKFLIIYKLLNYKFIKLINYLLSKDLIRFANEAYHIINLANEHNFFTDDHLKTVQYTCRWRTVSINKMLEFRIHQKQKVNHR